MFGKQLRDTTESRSPIKFLTKIALKGYFECDIENTWFSSKDIEALQLSGFKRSKCLGRRDPCYISWAKATTGTAKELYDITMEARLKKYDEHIDYIKNECIERSEDGYRSAYIKSLPYHPNIYKWLEENNITTDTLDMKTIGLLW